MAKLKPEDLEKIAARMRRQTVLREGAGRAKVTVHMGTCGIAAGARKIMSALLGSIGQQGIDDVILTTSGCAGLCSREPMMTVELKDHNGQYQTWNFPALGKGIVDIPGVLRILKKQGYAGPLVMEIEGVRGIERDQTKIKKDITDSAAYVRSLGRFK